MTFIITYRYKGESAERTAEASSAATAVKFHDQLLRSEAKVLYTHEDGKERSLGELKNEAGKEASSGGRK